MHLTLKCTNFSGYCENLEQRLEGKLLEGMRFSE